ncbi:thymidine kinase [Taibaiella lutea]|uniref:Thymidine kinase n=1 Tax=Taibaiella lutea TaxID=2608001 RepID=A0A5M6CFW3_9BACT|nr:thymidine kinase [Taibaiella lutea]KAA5533330.1 thymidine kinase [Taibaiella lutea]
MFIEPFKSGNNTGWIEVICGSMFSGKTEELIRRLKRAQIAKQRIEIFKPSVEKRYHETEVVSHDESRIRSTPVTASQNILLLAEDAEVIGIDEAQFFDAELPNVAETLASKGVRVIVAGLDMDFQGQPFGPIPALLAKADYITKLHAICVKCGSIANYSFRTSSESEKFVLGEQDKYEPRCRSCFQKV